MKKKIICVIVSIVMCLSLMPAPVFAEGHDLTVMNLDGLAEEGTDYEWDTTDPNRLIIKKSGLTVFGETEKEYIVVWDGVENLTIAGLTIETEEDYAIDFYDDSELILKGSNNTLISDDTGLCFDDDAVISGSGSLTVTGLYDGIYVDGELEISASGSIIAKGGSYGIYGYEGIAFTNAESKVLAYGNSDGYGAITWSYEDMTIAEGLLVTGSATFEADEDMIADTAIYNGTCVMVGDTVAKSVLITKILPDEGHDLVVKKGGEKAVSGTDYEWDTTDPNKLIIKKDGLTVSGDTEKEYIVTEEGVSDLTIDGLSIAIAGNDPIEMLGDCELIVKDSNNLNCEGYYFAIHFQGNGKISGSGSLVTEGYHGVYAYKTLEAASSGSIIAKGGYSGLFGSEGIVFTNAGGKVIAYGDSDDGAITWSYPGMTVTEGLTVKGSTVYEAAEIAITDDVTFETDDEGVKVDGEETAKSVRIFVAPDLTVKRGDVPATEGTDYERDTTDPNKLIIKTDGLTVSGTTEKEYIVVQDGVEDLTIDGVSITNGEDAIQFTGDSNLILKGDNTLTSTTNGIAFDADGEISGNGNLAVSGNIHGIYACGTLTVSASGNITIDGSGNYVVGIYGKTGIDFEDTVGKVLVYGESTLYGAITCDAGYGMSAAEGLTVKGSAVYKETEDAITNNVSYDKTAGCAKVGNAVARSVLITGAGPIETKGEYKVVHYIETLAGGFTDYQTETLEGTVGTEVTAEDITIDGFQYDPDNAQNVKTGTITGSGEEQLVLKLYYKINRYTVYYEYEGTVPKGASELPKSTAHKFLEIVTVAANASAPGYTFSGWKKDGKVVSSFGMTDSDVTLKGSFTANGAEIKYQPEQTEREVPDAIATADKINYDDKICVLPGDGTWTAPEGLDESDTDDVYIVKSESCVDIGKAAAPEGQMFLGWSYEKKDLPTFTAIYASDVLGNKDPDTGEDLADGIPDKYQSFSTFKITHGTWSTDKADEIKAYAVLYAPDGKTWAEDGKGHLTSDQIPTGMKAATGYKTGSWYSIDLSIGSDEIIGDEITSAHGFTYEYRPEPISYTVKFDPNGGEGSMENESFTYDAEQALTKNEFTREGYIFSGWGLTEDAISAEYDDGAAVKNLTDIDGKTVTLYAIWSAEPRVISYQPVQTGAETPESKTTNVVYDGPIRLILEDESFSPAVKGTYTPPEGLSTSGKPNIYIVRANLDIGKAAAPDKYVFIGWDYTNLDGIPTYTARFRSFGYTVKFDANTGSGSMEDESFLYNEEKALTANAFTKTGYSFKGWAYDPEAYTPDLADGEAVKNLATEDGVEVTLYALWKIKDVEIKYQPEQPGDEVPDSIPTKDVFRYSDTIFVDPGDGTWTAPEGLTESEYEDVYIITSETGIDIGKALAPDGKVFLGWGYKTSAFTAIYADDVLGGKDPKTGEDLADGVPDKYQHYSEFSVLHGTWNDGTKDKIKEYATLYKYNPDGMFWFEEGSGHLKESQVPTGMIADTGYKAGAWTIFPDGTARTVKQIADDYVTHQWASREYYKYRYEFTPISYTVKFDANTGSGTMTDMSFLYDEEKALSANIFTKEGFNFLGWSTDAEATEAEYEDGATVKNLTAEDGAEVTLYAVWEHANHSYGPASYSWDGDQCTATRVCSGCAEGTKGHSETETKKGVYVKDTDATCDKAETGHYEVAKFDNPAFEPQQSEKDTAVNGNPKGHDYKAEQYNEEQHRLVCRNDESHSYMEDHTFAGNKCTACGYVRSDNPQTGDDSNMILWLAIAAGAALLGVTALRRRKKMR